jgi:hypothetical protein
MTCSGESALRAGIGEPLPRLPSLRFPGFQLGPDCNLDHTVAPFSEDLIRLVDLIECEPVREEWGQTQPPMPDQFHQPAHALFATRAERCDNLMISEAACKRLHRQREFSSVHTKAGERPTGSQNAECALEGGLGSQRLDGHVDAPAVSEMLDLDRIFFGEVEPNVRAHAF